MLHSKYSSCFCSWTKAGLNNAIIIGYENVNRYTKILKKDCGEMSKNKSVNYSGDIGAIVPVYRFLSNQIYSKKLTILALIELFHFHCLKL